MNVFSVIKNVFKASSIAINERLSTVESSFTIPMCSLPSTESLQFVSELIPSRDNFTIMLIIDSGDMACFINNQVNEFDLSALISELQPDDNIYIKINIDKHVEDEIFSIYDFNSFSNDLLQRPILEVLSWFSDRLHGHSSIRFEVFDSEISFSTKTMAFVSSDNASFEAKIDRKQRIKSCRETANFYNMNTFEVIPDDFIIEGIMNAGDELKALFGKLSNILSIAYVATSAFIVDRVINLQINGQRTTHHELSIDNLPSDETWQSMYTWIFTDGNATDKALIARNVISLHCKYEALCCLDKTVFEAIKTNYGLYLRDNVSQYLDMKRDISKFIQNIVAQIGDNALSILNKFKANLIAIFSFLFTVVLTQIGQEQDWKDIFTSHTLYLVEIFMLGSLAYMVICFSEVCFKLQKTRNGYFELKNNYKDVLSAIEIKDAFGDDRLLKDTEQSTKKGMIIWGIVWGILLILSVVVIEAITANHGLVVWLWKKISGS